RAIYQDEWKWRMQLAGAWTEDSDETGRKPSRTLPDVSPKALWKQLDYLDGVLRQLDGIDVAALSPGEQVNYAIYRPQIEHKAAEIRLRDHEMPFTSDSAFWSSLDCMARANLRSADDYRA